MHSQIQRIRVKIGTCFEWNLFPSSSSYFVTFAVNIELTHTHQVSLFIDAAAAVRSACFSVSTSRLIVDAHVLPAMRICVARAKKNTKFECTIFGWAFAYDIFISFIKIEFVISLALTLLSDQNWLTYKIPATNANSRTADWLTCNRITLQETIVFDLIRERGTEGVDMQLNYYFYFLTFHLLNKISLQNLRFLFSGCGCAAHLCGAFALASATK